MSKSRHPINPLALASVKLSIFLKMDVEYDISLQDLYLFVNEIEI